jgi:hypothetical protein
MASRTKQPTTKRRSNLGFWVAFGFILWAALLPAPAPAAEKAPARQPGNECRVDVNPMGTKEVFLLPCSKVEPSAYPMVWFWEGQEV